MVNINKSVTHLNQLCCELFLGVLIISMYIITLVKRGFFEIKTLFNLSLVIIQKRKKQKANSAILFLYFSYKLK